MFALKKDSTCNGQKWPMVVKIWPKLTKKFERFLRPQLICWNWLDYNSGTDLEVQEAWIDVWQLVILHIECWGTKIIFSVNEKVKIDIWKTHPYSVIGLDEFSRKRLSMSRNPYKNLNMLNNRHETSFPEIL